MNDEDLDKCAEHLRNIPAYVDSFNPWCTEAMREAIIWLLQQREADLRQIVKKKPRTFRTGAKGDDQRPLERCNTNRSI